MSPKCMADSHTSHYGLNGILYHVAEIYAITCWDDLIYTYFQTTFTTSHMGVQLKWYLHILLPCRNDGILMSPYQCGNPEWHKLVGPFYPITQVNHAFLRKHHCNICGHSFAVVKLKWMKIQCFEDTICNITNCIILLYLKRRRRHLHIPVAVYWATVSLILNAEVRPGLAVHLQGL